MNTKQMKTQTIDNAQLPELPDDIWSLILRFRSDIINEEAQERYEEMERLYLAKWEMDHQL